MLMWRLWHVNWTLAYVSCRSTIVQTYHPTDCYGIVFHFDNSCYSIPSPANVIRLTSCDECTSTDGWMNERTNGTVNRRAQNQFIRYLPQSVCVKWLSFRSLSRWMQFISSQRRKWRFVISSSLATDQITSHLSPKLSSTTLSKWQNKTFHVNSIRWQCRCRWNYVKILSKVNESEWFKYSMTFWLSSFDTLDPSRTNSIENENFCVQLEVCRKRIYHLIDWRYVFAVAVRNTLDVRLSLSRSWAGTLPQHQFSSPSAHSLYSNRNNSVLVHKLCYYYANIEVIRKNQLRHSPQYSPLRTHLAGNSTDNSTSTSTSNGECLYWIASTEDGMSVKQFRCYSEWKLHGSASGLPLFIYSIQFVISHRVGAVLLRVKSLRHVCSKFLCANCKHLQFHRSFRRFFLSFFDEIEDDDIYSIDHHHPIQSFIQLSSYDDVACHSTHFSVVAVIWSEGVREGNNEKCLLKCVYTSNQHQISQSNVRQQLSNFQPNADAKLCEYSPTNRNWWLTSNSIHVIHSEHISSSHSIRIVAVVTDGDGGAAEH